jgi:hypothetical protein
MLWEGEELAWGEKEEGKWWGPSEGEMQRAAGGWRVWEEEERF